MDPSYQLSRAIIERLAPDDVPKFDVIWKATSERRTIIPVKEDVLPLTGPEIVGSIAIPIMVAITSRLVIDALDRVARSRRRRGINVSVQRQAIQVSSDYGIAPKEARKIVRSILRLLDENPEILAQCVKNRDRRGSPRSTEKRIRLRGRAGAHRARFQLVFLVDDESEYYFNPRGSPELDSRTRTDFWTVRSFAMTTGLKSRIQDCAPRRYIHTCSNNK